MLATAELAGATKREVRDAVRIATPDGEVRWQALQARVYAHRMADAVLVDGAGAFLTACAERRVPVAIVSHKTRYARRDAARVDLRRSALHWMEEQGFFDRDGYSFPRGNVFFEPTRSEKVARIAACGCSDFIDDLEEVFRETGFPPATRRHLYAPQAGALPEGPFAAYRSWRQIADAIF
jgi:hypothetical protein